MARKINARNHEITRLSGAIMVHKAGILGHDFIEIDRDILFRDVTDRSLNLQARIIRNFEIWPDFNVKLVLKIAFRGDSQTLNIKIGFVDRIQRIVFGQLFQAQHQDLLTYGV